MPRTARKYLWTETAAYHVINRGHNRETVFSDEEEMGYFLTLLCRYRDRFDAQIYHYCLMSNHFHLLLRLPQPQRLSSFMADLLRPTSIFTTGGKASLAICGRGDSKVRWYSGRAIG